MATSVFLTNNILNISKSLLFPLLVSLLSPCTSPFSTAFQRCPQGSEGSDDGAVREGIYEAKQQDIAMTNDAAKEGPIRAVEASEMARDSGKEAMDAGWKAAQQTVHEVEDNGYAGKKKKKGSNNN